MSSIATAVVPLEPLAVTVPEAARLLGVSAALVYEMVARGELKAVRLGRRLVVPIGSLHELIGAAEDGRSSVPTGPKP